MMQNMRTVSELANLWSRSGGWAERIRTTWGSCPTSLNRPSWKVARTPAARRGLIKGKLEAANPAPMIRLSRRGQVSSTRPLHEASQKPWFEHVQRKELGQAGVALSRASQVTLP